MRIKLIDSKEYGPTSLHIDANHFNEDGDHLHADEKDADGKKLHGLPERYIDRIRELHSYGNNLN